MTDTASVPPPECPVHPDNTPAFCDGLCDVSHLAASMSRITQGRCVPRHHLPSRKATLAADAVEVYGTDLLYESLASHVEIVLGAGEPGGFHDRPESARFSLEQRRSLGKLVGTLGVDMAAERLGWDPERVARGLVPIAAVSADQVRVVLAGMAEGLRTGAIAFKSGMAERTCCDLTILLGRKPDPRSMPFDPIKAKQAAEQRASGLTWPAIAKRFGVPDGTVRGWVKRLALEGAEQVAA